VLTPTAGAHRVIDVIDHRPSTPLQLTMPSAAAFRKAFGLAPGAAVGRTGYAVASASVDHVVETQYERYRFPIVLELTAAEEEEPAAKGGRGRKPSSTSSSSSAARALPTGAKLLEGLRVWAGGVKRAYSEYGSPYDCSISGWKVVVAPPPPSSSSSSGGGAGGVTVYATGLAVRDHKSPTLKELSQKARDEAGGPLLSPSSRARVEHTHRIIKSHFATGSW
jgi:hypothetical protein